MMDGCRFCPHCWVRALGEVRALVTEPRENIRPQLRWCWDLVDWYRQRRGWVERYPCTCHEGGICWIVRHPKLDPPISYETEAEARATLRRLR